MKICTVTSSLARLRRHTAPMVAAALAACVLVLAGPAGAAPAPQAARGGGIKPRQLALAAGRSKGFVKAQIGKGGVAVTCSKRGVRLTFVVFSTTPKIKVRGNGPLLVVVPAGRTINVSCT